MRILLINRHYGGEHVPTGRMLGDVAEALIKRGHEVVALTARSSYVATASSEDSGTAPSAKVIFLPTFGEKRRLASWVSFLVQACARAPFIKWDRCVVLTDPPFLGALSILLRPFGGKRAGLFWWTMDLYPEILAGSGMLTETSVLYAILRRVNEAVISRMGGFVLLGNCQLERMRKYATWKDRDFIIAPPWDNRPIERVERDQNRFLRKYGLENKKVALYAGNLGEGHTYTAFVAAARELVKSGRDDWMFVFVIRGSKKQSLIREVEGLANVLVLDYQPPDWTSDLLWAADAHLITINARSKGLVVPSKLYGVLRTDAPVLFVGPYDADTADEIRRYNAGEALEDSCDGAEVVAALDRLRSAWIGGELTRSEIDFSGPERIAEFVTR